MKKKLKIGWYCPYAYIPLEEHENVIPVAIRRDSNQHFVFGSTRLCKKLTAVYENLESGKLDGIVLTNCCNLSQYISPYLKKEFSEIPVFIMDISCKQEAVFNRLSGQLWQEIKFWIDSSHFADSRVVNTDEDNAIATNCGKNNMDCCLFTQEIKNQNDYLPIHQIKEILQKRNICPIGDKVNTDMCKTALERVESKWIDALCKPLSFLMAELDINKDVIHEHIKT